MRPQARRCGRSGSNRLLAEGGHLDAQSSQAAAGTNPNRSATDAGPTETNAAAGPVILKESRNRWSRLGSCCLARGSPSPEKPITPPLIGLNVSQISAA